LNLTLRYDGTEFCGRPMRADRATARPGGGRRAGAHHRRAPDRARLWAHRCRRARAGRLALSAGANVFE